MLRRLPLFLFVCICTGSLHAQSLADIEIHGFVTQGFLFSSHNNYLTMQSSSGSLQWTDGAVSVSDSLTDKLRVGIQLHMYQLGQLGGPNIQVDWASGDYRVNDHLGFRAGKVKTPLRLVQRLPGCGRRLPLDTLAARRLPDRQPEFLFVAPGG